MASSRDRTEIVTQILEALYDHDYGGEGGDGITQTNILYAAYLSSDSLREYLIALTVHGLLIYDPTMRTYHINIILLRGVYDFLNYIASWAI